MKSKHLIFFIVATTLTLVAMLEWLHNGTLLFFLFWFSVIVGLLGLGLKKEFGRLAFTCGLAILTSWILYYMIYQYQSKLAYDTIKSIPSDRLINFYKTGDYAYIPEDMQYTWIGVKRQRISKLVESRMGHEIKAVGWIGNSVHGYYELKDRYYATSTK